MGTHPPRPDGLIATATQQSAHRRHHHLPNRCGHPRRRGYEAATAAFFIRESETQPPRQLWVADITYVRTWQDWPYVAVVVDTYSRRVAGWSMRDDLRAELVVDALEMALWRRQPATASSTTQTAAADTPAGRSARTLRDSGLPQSMGSRGDAYANAQARAS